MPPKRLRLRQTGRRRDVEAFIAHRGGDLSLCRKAAKYIARTGGLFNDVAGLRELRAALFAPDERAGCLDERITNLERGVESCHGDN